MSVQVIISSSAFRKAACRAALVGVGVQVGIYKTDNATKSVAINPADFVAGAAPAALPAPVPTAA